MLTGWPGTKKVDFGTTMMSQESFIFAFHTCSIIIEGKLMYHVTGRREARAYSEYFLTTRGCFL